MLITKFTGKILSILFRLIIVFYALFIIITEDNALEIYWYFISIIPYGFIYFKTLFRDDWLSKIRLLNDFIFITFILFGKELVFFNLIFLSLPIINAPNHSGEKKSTILYLLYIISFIVINEFVWSWTFIVVTSSLWLINAISNLRFQYFNNISKLNEQIEIFLEKDLQINKTYKIYTGLINSINSINLIIGFKPYISQIVCFRVINDRLYLENSSKFVWSYFIDEDNRSKLKDNDYNNGIPLNINGKELPNNFFIFNKSRSEEYVFVFISKKPLTNKIGVIYLKKVLTSVTNRISKVIGIENSLKSENKRMLQDFRNKYFQIQNSEKAMHFIRNRFNTLDNFIEMSKDNIEGIMDNEDKLLYKTELERLERNYKILMDRVKSILDKSDKPFSATKLQAKTISYTFNLIREVWLDYFQEFNAEVNIDFSITEKFAININSDGLYILIADWVSNLKKYSISGEKVIFNESDDFFLVTFENNFSIENKLEIESLMADFNSKERDKILQRTSYGVLIMKSILEEMSVKGIIELSNNVLKLELTFNKLNNENSDF